jgi:hypothetical protein
MTTTTTRSLVVLTLAAVLAVLCPAGSAQDITVPVIVANNDNPATNSASGYTLGGVSEGTLNTGGIGLGSGYFAATSEAVSSNGHCVFVVDDGSDDVASFASPSYALVGKSGFPGMFSAGGLGGSVALAPNGKCLYTGNSGTMNVSAWRVNASCSITHIADYIPSLGPDLYSPLAVTPDGKRLIVPAPNHEAAELFDVNANCTLTDVNNINWANVIQCAVNSTGCSPTGLDITNDSKIVIFGNAAPTPSALSASITPGGLVNPGYWDLTNLPGLQSANVPWFSKAGAAGSGQIYFGMSGPPSGEVTANFTESPLTITVAGATPLGPPVGAIRTVGTTMVIAELPNLIQTATISGSSLLPGPITPDPKAVNLTSLEVYPKSR